MAWCQRGSVDRMDFTRLVPFSFILVNRVLPVDLTGFRKPNRCSLPIEIGHLMCWKR